MKIWILVGGFDYEGEDASGLEIYTKQPTQEEEDLFQGSYDYIIVVEEEVDTHA